MVSPLVVVVVRVLAGAAAALDEKRAGRLVQGAFAAVLILEESLVERRRGQHCQIEDPADGCLDAHNDREGYRRGQPMTAEKTLGGPGAYRVEL